MKQRWFLSDPQRQFLVNFPFFCEIFRCISILKQIFQSFSHIWEKKWTTKNYLFNFLTGQRYNKTEKFGFFVTAQVTKCYGPIFQKALSRLVAKVPRLFRKNWVFAENWGNLQILQNLEAILLTTSCVFNTCGKWNNKRVEEPRKNFKHYSRVYGKTFHF